MDGLAEFPSARSQLNFLSVSQIHMSLTHDSVLIAGGGGFIGGHLVARLKETGYKKIRSVDRRPLDEWYQVHDGV